MAPNLTTFSFDPEQEHRTTARSTTVTAAHFREIGARWRERINGGPKPIVDVGYPNWLFMLCLVTGLALEAVVFDVGAGGLRPSDLAARADD
jgi:hypothetical protein